MVDIKGMKEEEVISAINSVEGLKFVKWDVKFRGKSSKAFIQMGCGHEERRTVDYLLTKSKTNLCEDCRRKDQTLIEPDAIQRIHEAQGVTFVEWFGGYKGASSRVKIKYDCGHTLTVSFNTASKGSVTGECTSCKNISNKSDSISTISEEDYINRVDSTGTHIFIRWEGEFDKYRSKVVILNNCGHEEVKTITAASVKSRTGMCSDCRLENKVWGHDSSPEYYIDLINKTGTHTFLRWVDVYKNSSSEAVILHRCGHEEVKTATNASTPSKTGICRGCSSFKEEDRVKQINETTEFRFIKWAGEYRSTLSNVVVKHTCGYKWKTRLTTIIHHKTSCPKCRNIGGFNIKNRGFLYFLQSECGNFCKIGISNVPFKRFAALKSDTPFPFFVRSVCINDDGQVTANQESRAHRRFAEDNALLRGFDGATEWFVYSDDIFEYFNGLSGEHTDLDNLGKWCK